MACLLRVGEVQPTPNEIRWPIVNGCRIVSYFVVHLLSGRSGLVLPGQLHARTPWIEVEWANEALEDPDALRIDPDPSSRSGRSVRTIGNSTGAGCLVTVITVEEAGITYGVNGWKSNEIDIRRYREERL
jgi:hypothetical protein